MDLKQAIEKAFSYHRAGDLKIAESIYDQLLCQINAPDANIMFGYGTLLVSQQKYGLGLALLHAAMQSAPDFAPGWTNIACAYKHLGKDALAMEAYDKAFALEPNQPDILAGLAGFWVNKGDAAKVIDYASRALAFDPNHAAAHMHMGLGLLEQGRHAEAWPHYEHRWSTVERLTDRRPYKAPLWEGKPIKTLAIHGEQGLGDEILFMSLLSKARPLAENIIIECAERLIPTFQTSFGLPCYKDHQSLISAHGEPDAYIPMASLPGILGLPDGRPFLRRERLFVPGPRPRIGIAWKGGTVRTNHRDRSLGLDDLAPILDLKGFDFVPVQYGDGSENLHLYGMFNLRTDFDSIHARIAGCDLVISVCQTAVHQAGAMGVDCWTLVPERAAWRYCGTDMRPWYNSVKFFRQEGSSWEVPIQMIAASLKERYALAA